MTDKIILYDGNCNLCHGSVRFIQKHDRKSQFTYISLQSAPAKELLESVGFNQPDVDSVIYLENNQTYLKSEAFFEITDRIGGFYKIFSVLKIFPLKWLNIGYDFIARKRHKFISDRSVCSQFNTIHNKHV